MSLRTYSGRPRGLSGTAVRRHLAIHSAAVEVWEQLLLDAAASVGASWADTHSDPDVRRRARWDVVSRWFVPRPADTGTAVDVAAVLAAHLEETGADVDAWIEDCRPLLDAALRDGSVWTDQRAAWELRSSAFTGDFDGLARLVTLLEDPAPVDITPGKAEMRNANKDTSAVLARRFPRTDRPADHDTKLANLLRLQAIVDDAPLVLGGFDLSGLDALWGGDSPDSPGSLKAWCFGGVTGGQTPTWAKILHPLIGAKVVSVEEHTRLTQTLAAAVKVARSAAKVGTGWTTWSRQVRDDLFAVGLPDEDCAFKGTFSEACGNLRSARSNLRRQLAERHETLTAMAVPPAEADVFAALDDIWSSSPVERGPHPKKSATRRFGELFTVGPTDNVYAVVRERLERDRGRYGDPAFALEVAIRDNALDLVGSVDAWVARHSAASHLERLRWPTLPPATQRNDGAWVGQSTNAGPAALANPDELTVTLKLYGSNRKHRAVLASSRLSSDLGTPGSPAVTRDDKLSRRVAGVTGPASANLSKMRVAVNLTVDAAGRPFIRLAPDLAAVASPRNLDVGDRIFGVDLGVRHPAAWSVLEVTDDPTGRPIEVHTGVKGGGLTASGRFRRQVAVGTVDDPDGRREMWHTERIVAVAVAKGCGDRELQERVASGFSSAAVRADEDASWLIGQLVRSMRSRLRRLGRLAAAADALVDGQWAVAAKNTHAALGRPSSCGRGREDLVRLIEASAGPVAEHFDVLDRPRVGPVERDAALSAIGEALVSVDPDAFVALHAKHSQSLRPLVRALRKLAFGGRVDAVLARRIRANIGSGPAVLPGAGGGRGTDRLALIDAVIAVLAAWHTRPVPGSDPVTLPELYAERLRRLRRNQRNDFAWQMANTIVELAVSNGCSAIALEDLSNLGPSLSRSRRENRMLAQWAKAHLGERVVMLAELHGLAVRPVSAAWTSQIDQATGVKGTRLRLASPDELRRERRRWEDQLERVELRSTGTMSGFNKALDDSKDRLRAVMASRSVTPVLVPDRAGPWFTSDFSVCGGPLSGKVVARVADADVNAAGNIAHAALERLVAKP